MANFDSLLYDFKQNDADQKPEGIKDSRAHMPRFQGENFYNNLKLVEKIRSLAAEKDCTPAQREMFRVPGIPKDS